MAYIVKARGARWEIRESIVTENGPRSKTLATFAALDDDVIARAATRSRLGVTREDLIRAARRAGSPVKTDAAQQAARDLLSELESGARLSPALRRTLADALDRSAEERDAGNDTASDAIRAMAGWAGAGERERSDALIDLLHLADAIPAPSRRAGRRFPRLKPVRP